MSVARLTAQRDKAILEREEMELELRQLQAKNELLDVLKSKPMTIAKVILIFFLKDKGKLIIIGLTILSVSSCMPLVPLVERTPATDPPRSIRVAIVHENFWEKEILSTAKMIHEGFGRYPGVRLGAVTTIPIDLGGCRTLSAIYRKAFQTCIPLGPKYADIFVIRTNRLLYQDGFFMVCGMVQLGSTENVYRRFVIMRTNDATIMGHELYRVFHKKGVHRRFDGWYMTGESDESHESYETRQNESSDVTESR